jgi:hypothetical protein
MSNNDPDLESAGRRIGAGFLFRAARSLAVTILVLGVAIFLPAWDIKWWGGWLFLLLFLALTSMGVVYLWRVNPEIFVARSKIQAGTRAWDMVLLIFLLGALLAIFPVAGLDHRHQWSLVPVWLVVVGHVLFTPAFATLHFWVGDRLTWLKP